MAVTQPPGGFDARSPGDERRAILQEAMWQWVRRHPDPDRPVFGFTGGKFVSPRQLATAVGDDSELGRQFLRSVDQVVAKVGFETYVKSIERSGASRFWWVRRLLVLWRRRLKREPQQPARMS